MNRKDNFWIKIIYIVSIIISGAVAFLILGPRPDGINGSLDVSALPTVNASLNALTTALLVLGYILNCLILVCCIVVFIAYSSPKVLA